MSRLSFFAELQRRHVYKVGAMYAVAGWLLVQVVTQVFPIYEVSAHAQRLIVGVIVAGFPVALVLAWLFDLTPDGIVRTPERLASGINVENQPARRGIERRLNLVLGGLLLLSLAYLALGPATLRPDAAGSDSSNGGEGQSIAVLPLADLGGDANDSYLGDGISGEVLTALSKLPGLKVIGRTSSFQFRGRDVDAAKVGKLLNVRHLLAGTVQRSGDQLRISVELVDTDSGRQLWSQHYDRSFENLFVLEDDISAAVSKALAVQLGTAAGHPLVDVATDNPKAHDLLLRGNQLIQHSDEASQNQAVALFKEALREDPDYAAAWAALSRTYIGLADAYRAPNELLPVMRGAAEKAVALAPDLAEAHAVLGEVLLNYVRDYPSGHRELERAIALNPGSPSAHDSLATYRYEIDHDAAGARAEEQAAEKLDPLNPWYVFWEMVDVITLGDFTTAETLANRVLALDPKFFYRSDPLVQVYAASEQWQRCLDRAEAVAAAGQTAPDFAAAICHQHAGDSAYASRILKALEAAARSGYADRSIMAALRLAFGDADGAMADLEQADRDRSAPLLSVWGQRWFASLHDDPRYKALMARIGTGSTPLGGT